MAPAPAGVRTGETSGHPGGTGTGAGGTAPGHRAAERPRTRRIRPLPGPAGWPLRRSLTMASVVMAVVTLAAIVVGAMAITNLDAARSRLVDRIGPAAIAASQLNSALLDQETGVRGYALGTRPELLAPYTDGRTAQTSAAALLRTQLVDTALGGSTPARGGDLSAHLDALDAAVTAWRTGYADPTIAQVRATGQQASTDVEAGHAAFDAVRAAFVPVQADVDAIRVAGRADLAGTASRLTTVLVTIAVVLLLVISLLVVALRAAAITPLVRLAGEARQVADGDFGHEVTVSGPSEVTELAQAVDQMRTRILGELAMLQSTNAALDATTEELRRSNAELEQFAYIASHDLQEPLRKVASFCQLLQRRYRGALDERADQYIHFAVDGAKRMQVLINDLLAFSRVGRFTRDKQRVDATTLVDQAAGNVATAIEESGAVLEHGQLPAVLGEAPLLTAVFQNLISNAIKFRGDSPPHIAVRADRDGDAWRFSVTDHGIGIEAEYAERIFVIFQRLHSKEAYAGTGIGLAMCRKIVEYHGGRIWLDTEHTDGTRFCFTLPVIGEPVPDDRGAHGVGDTAAAGDRTAGGGAAEDGTVSRTAPTAGGSG